MADKNENSQQNLMLEDHLVLEYAGGAVERGRMDSRRVASAIIAFSDFLDIVTESAYGRRVQLQTEVQGFRGESFDIDFAYQLFGHVATLWSTAPSSPADVMALIKGAFDLWRHLRAEPPKSAHHAGDRAQQIHVENNQGTVLAVTAEVFNVVANAISGTAVGSFIHDPLRVMGLDSVRIRSRASGETTPVLREEGGCFIPVDVEQPLADEELKTWLVVESPNFKEGNKWRVFDGQTSYSVSMEDENYLQAIDEGAERFGKGDMLHVRMRIKQTSAPGRLTTERSILEVLDHKLGAEQKRMFED